MPDSVSEGQAVDTMRTLRDSWLALKAAVAPSTGQLRPEFLVTLAEAWKEGSSSWDMVESFVMKHVSGVFPPWYFKLCMTVETVQDSWTSHITLSPYRDEESVHKVNTQGSDQAKQQGAN